MKQLIEEIKPIEDYEELYSISNYGYVISEAKEWTMPTGGMCKKERTVMKARLSGGGYLVVNLCNNGKKKTVKIHILVWDHFGIGKRNGFKLQVDHKIPDKTNNQIDNLQLLTARQNVTKYFKTQKTSSKYPGVWWNKRIRRWRTSIYINKKPIHLGHFTDEYVAHLIREGALNKLLKEEE